MVETFLRQPAIKVSIADLHQGTFTPGKDSAPGSMALANGQVIDRINLIGIILHKEQIGTITNLFLDDGTGKIIARLFEEIRIEGSLMVGTALLVIGKVRVYNQEKYLSPEILKIVHPAWLKVRSLELGLKTESSLQKQQEEPTKTRKRESGPDLLEEEDIFENGVGRDEGPLLPNQKLSHLIKELDSGSGAFIEEIIEKSPLQDTEAALQKMLEKGDIFQISPGKVKVL